MSYSLLEAAQAILSIRILLNSHPTVKQWKYNLLNLDESQRKDFRHFDEVPGRITATMTELPGGITATTGEPPLYPIYQCPECDYQWFQHQWWDTPPLCPHHNILLHKLES